MTKDDVKPGDLVQLCSGGPTMAFEAETVTGDALCAWFDNAKLMRATFAYAILTRAE